MNKLFASALSLLMLIGFVSPAGALERADPDPGNPRVVYIGGCTGFLYAPRIVLTAAHCLYRNGEEWDMRVLPPGLRTPQRTTSENSVAVIKKLQHPEYRDRVFGETARHNDFAVLILEKPLANVSTAKLIDEPTLLAMAESRSEIIQSGYGFQSLADRNNKTEPRQVFPMTAKFKLLPKQEGIRRIRDHVAAIDYVQRYQEDLVMLSQPFGGPQLCDGDSGSGFYLRDGNDFTYLGVLEGPLGISNCFYETAEALRMRVDATVGMFPVYRGLDQIREAEAFLAVNPIAIKSSKNYVLPSFGASLSSIAKARIKNYVEANSGATKFVCTSVRLSSTSRAESIAMRAQAKVACEYAKSLDPKLSTWVQSKASTKRSALGMQLITIKFD